MIDKKLAEKFPFVSNYFENAQKLERMPQSIVFEGLDAYAQLFFALELARIANCKNDKSPECTCINCNWIRSNSHPAINFVSQLHNKPIDDDTKTMISVKQAKLIEKELREGSDYHRFYIFFDAKAQSLAGANKKSYDEFCPSGYEICPNEDFTVNPINKKTFNEAALNVLLKSVEEPPNGTTFVFLTRNRADLLNTIVSRSQVFKLSAKFKKENNNEIAQIFENYPNITFNLAFEISESLQNWAKENEVGADFILNMILDVISNYYKNNCDTKTKTDLKALSEAFLWAKSSMQNKVIFDTLMLKIAKNRGLK